MTLHTLILIAALVAFIVASLDYFTNSIRIIALGLALFIASMFVTGCQTVSRWSDQYAAHVESQSVQITVNGQTQTGMIGTTIVFRKPDTKPVAVTVTPVGTSPVPPPPTSPK